MNERDDERHGAGAGPGEGSRGSGEPGADPSEPRGRGRETWSSPLAEVWDLFGDVLEGVRGLPATALRGPRLDVVRAPAEYLILVDLPGVAREDVEVSLSGDELAIAGRRRGAELPPGSESVRAEREHGRFRRVVRLWPDADPSDVRARLEDGVLRITVPRRTGGERKRVEVET